MPPPDLRCGAVFSNRTLQIPHAMRPADHDCFVLTHKDSTCCTGWKSVMTVTVMACQVRRGTHWVRMVKIAAWCCRVWFESAKLERHPMRGSLMANGQRRCLRCVPVHLLVLFSFSLLFRNRHLRSPGFAPFNGAIALGHPESLTALLSKTPPTLDLVLALRASPIAASVGWHPA